MEQDDESDEEQYTKDKNKNQASSIRIKLN